MLLAPLVTNLAAGTAALAVALVRPADPPPLSEHSDIPGGYLSAEDLRGSEPDDGQNQVTLGSILFSLGGLRVGAGVVGLVTAMPDRCAQVYGSSVADNTCSGLRIYGASGIALGGLMMISGVVILSMGLVKRHQHRKWRHERGMAFGPTLLGPQQYGVTFGFRF